MKRLKELLFILQLEEYDIERFKNWLRKNRDTAVAEEKRKLVWTSKSKIILILSLPFLFKSPEIALILAVKLIKPFEDFLKNIIVFLAQRKISSMKNLTVIGITGSYGKTSVKEILFHILNSKYQTLKTPESFNTILGVSGVILKELKTKHEFFVVEMGMYGPGEIKRLCDVVKPKAGIVTAVGLSHLERAGSIENIFKAKSELVYSLPKGGLIVLNCENELCEKMAKVRSDLDVVCAGFKKINNNSLWATDIKTTENGTSFNLLSGRGQVKITTCLLGRHNALDIVLASGVALYYGLTLEEIKNCLTSLPSVPHRLQLMPGTNGSIIIDDSYNANPESVKSAIEVLKDFDSPTKIVVTPGMIELGEKQFEENKKFGELMGKVANYVLVVGETNRKAITEGLKKTKTEYFEMKDLKQASAKLSELVTPGSVILFENDLTDQYI